MHSFTGGFGNLVVSLSAVLIIPTQSYTDGVEGTI